MMKIVPGAFVALFFWAQAALAGPCSFENTSQMFNFMNTATHFSTSWQDNGQTIHMDWRLRGTANEPVVEVRFPNGDNQWWAQRSARYDGNNLLSYAHRDHPDTRYSLIVYPGCRMSFRGGGPFKRHGTEWAGF